MAQAAFSEGDRKIRLGVGSPVDPGAGEVQLQVSHCGICGTDLHIFHGAMDARVKMPLVMGHEVSATVQKLGAGVEGFDLGNRVVVMPLAPCADCPACADGHSHICHNLVFLGIDTPGAFQSYWTIPAYTVHRIPTNLSMAHAALIEPLAVACHDVRLANLRAGDHVVVLGGGPIGMLVALVRGMRAPRSSFRRLILTASSWPEKSDWKRSIPTETDLIERVMRWTKGRGADIVFEVSGSQAGADIMTELLRTRGLAVIVAIFAQKPKIDLFRFFWPASCACRAYVFTKRKTSPMPSRWRRTALCLWMS